MVLQKHISGWGAFGGRLGGGWEESGLPCMACPLSASAPAAPPTSSSPRANTRATPDSGQDASRVADGSWKTNQNLPIPIICLEEYVPQGQGTEIIDRFYWPIQRGSIKEVQVWVRYVCHPS